MNKKPNRPDSAYTEKNPRGAGRNKGNRSTKQYWTDPQTHEVLMAITNGRKSEQVTSEKLNEILGLIKN